MRGLIGTPLYKTRILNTDPPLKQNYFKVRQFVLDVQKQKQQRMCEDSGVDSYSRSVSPTSTTSLSPTPFQKHRDSEEELENSAPVAEVKCSKAANSENKENILVWFSLTSYQYFT